MPRMISCPCSPQLSGTECCWVHSLFTTFPPFYSSCLVESFAAWYHLSKQFNWTSCLYVASDLLSGAALSHADLLPHAPSRQGQLFNKKSEMHIS